MNVGRRRLLAIAAGVAALSATALPFLLPEPFHYLSGNTTAFVAEFPAPPARDSAQTRRELDALLELQRTRTTSQVDAARADRKKDVSRFLAALGFAANQAPSLPKLTALLDAAEDDIGPYVKAVKQKYRRLRPYEIEPRLEPCIGDVQGDLSYPSGHAAYGYLAGYLLTAMVPERSAELRARAQEFARQRMVCGVHFQSDIEAGDHAATLLAAMLSAVPALREDARAAQAELRAALGFPPREPAN